MAEPSPDASLGGIERYREQVLSQPWAQGISQDEVRTYLADLPRRRYPTVAYRERGAAPLVQPRGGFPTFSAQQQLTRRLHEAGADFIPLTIDSWQNCLSSSATGIPSRAQQSSRRPPRPVPLRFHRCAGIWRSMQWALAIPALQCG